MDDPLAARMLAGELSRQASMLAFVDAFTLVTWSFILMASLVWLLRRPAPAAPHRPAALSGH
ncbi:MAG: hypothetical protein WBQ78_08510 [Gammaproteobacteria bacterium]